MKYNLILKYKTLGQKAQTIAKYLEQKYPNTIEVSYNEFKLGKGYRNISLTQQPIKLNRYLLKEYINAIHFIKPEYLRFNLANKATNGFSVYKAKTKYNYFIPMMYDYKNEKNVNDLNIGYYFTPYRNNFKEFIGFLHKRNVQNDYSKYNEAVKSLFLNENKTTILRVINAIDQALSNKKFRDRIKPIFNLVIDNGPLSKLGNPN